ncbi:MAG: hemerythrin domain-containing protein [Enhygromyxa sp.]
MALRPRSSGPSDHQRLAEDHVRLDALFEQVLERARTGDWHECDKIWNEFSSALLEHFAFEEQQLFPDYAASSATARQEVSELLAEHDEVRELLDRIGVEIQLKRVDQPTIDALIARLRAHATRENAAFYPWVGKLPGKASGKLSGKA